jgi:SnoaL-like domain
VGDGPGARGRLVRALIEECWSDQAGLDRMADMLAPGYVHHTPWGDWDFTGFRAGMDYVDSLFADRRYRVVHIVDDGRLVAAFLAWSAVRRADQSLADGRGAYHCRLVGGLVTEDWDVFFPTT